LPSFFIILAGGAPNPLPPLPPLRRGLLPPSQLLRPSPENADEAAAARCLTTSRQISFIDEPRTEKVEKDEKIENIMY